MGRHVGEMGETGELCIESGGLSVVHLARKSRKGPIREVQENFEFTKMENTRLKGCRPKVAFSAGNAGVNTAEKAMHGFVLCKRKKIRKRKRKWEKKKKKKSSGTRNKGSTWAFSAYPYKLTQEIRSRRRGWGEKRLRGMSREVFSSIQPDVHCSSSSKEDIWQNKYIQ